MFIVISLFVVALGFLGLMWWNMSSIKPPEKEKDWMW